MSSMFFESWAGILRTLVIGTLAYGALVALLLISGKRTLTKLNAFDLVITVALGSTLATVLLSKDVTLAEGVAAFVLLIGLQFIVTWSSVRWAAFSRLVKADPTLLFYQGRMLERPLRQQRVTESEVRAVIRATGHSVMDEVEAVILETDGSFSVLPRVEGLAGSLQHDVDNYPPSAA
ncbi:MAG: DUF421 domain-containing protein [Anaerolineales bacterium]|nr:DUF421 domain-containing protein [Anaerolineales bacterium]MCO5180847.1 DUF421 domain-containing protein [Promineifilum sp.]